MKALTQQELRNFVLEMAPILKGAQLQEIVANDRGLALSFQAGATYWLVLDLVPNSPMMLLFEKHCPFKKSPKTKPVALFLNSHARNLYLQDLVIEEKWGRVVKLAFKNTQKECEVEVHLIPKQSNLIVRTEGKQIAWEKPLELREAPVVENPPEPRSFEAIHNEWLAQQQGAQKPSLDPQAQWEKQRQKDIEKKQKALVDIEKQLEAEKEKLWIEAGQYLKTHGTLDVPEHLKSFVNASESLSWNIENTFSKAKQLAGKKEGAKERLEILKKEIEALEKARFQDKKPAKTNLDDLMKKTDARGRKLTLPSGAVAYCGKSAADNLALLRQAKAWDYWLHLKDYPGAHAILHRQRDQKVEDSEIQEVAAWVARESLSSKSLMLGQKVAVVIVECRFVRPIKGDKLGRVTYHSERTLNFTLR
ncbi:DUF814 domain-containing protein [Bdellovibrio sp. HCB2-146]|uniref:DUF814 domain-containing protein n=1 Tax=Bdellovibrio sp. HCB2-146 TaxID=3394362 RepID=UPI0039BD7707